jgi:hypothetical protein
VCPSRTQPADMQHATSIGEFSVDRSLAIQSKRSNLHRGSEKAYGSVVVCMEPIVPTGPTRLGSAEAVQAAASLHIPPPLSEAAVHLSLTNSPRTNHTRLSSSTSEHVHSYIWYCVTSIGHVQLGPRGSRLDLFWQPLIVQKPHARN